MSEPIKVHNLKPAEGSRTSKKRVARGDRGRGGKTAGRGTKGTGARGSVPAWFEGGQMPIVRRQPKRPGFNNPNKVEYTAINVSVLEEQYEDGDTVSRETLTSKGLVRKNRPVKILGHGELTKKLTVEVGALSNTAREKIEAAGGSVTADDGQ
ncbi:MAG: 50S ribosomal protein L15 [Nitriliruptorales bacterium]|nr:50S ribosomal protein L15 [Nitriliruptorales bacterium]